MLNNLIFNGFKHKHSEKPDRLKINLLISFNHTYENPVV
jgi:hypothetical protein